MFSIFIQQTAKNNNLTLSGSQTLRTMTGTSREHIIQSQFIWHYKKEPANWWPSPAHRTNQLIEQSLSMQPVLPENMVLAQRLQSICAASSSSRKRRHFPIRPMMASFIRTSGARMPVDSMEKIK